MRLRQCESSSGEAGGERAASSTQGAGAAATPGGGLAGPSPQTALAAPRRVPANAVLCRLWRAPTAARRLASRAHPARSGMRRTGKEKGNGEK